MSESGNPFDARRGHEHFSAACFNRCWEIIDKGELDESDRDELIHVSCASLWHWQQREDCLPENMAIAYWMLSRAHAFGGNPRNAEKYAARCRSLNEKHSLSPFLTAYGFEASARAAKEAGKPYEAQTWSEKARALIASIDDDDSRELLLADLEDF